MPVDHRSHGHPWTSMDHGDVLNQRGSSSQLVSALKYPPVSSNMACWETIEIGDFAGDVPLPCFLTRGWWKMSFSGAKWCKVGEIGGLHKACPTYLHVFKQRRNGWCAKSFLPWHLDMATWKSWQCGHVLMSKCLVSCTEVSLLVSSLLAWVRISWCRCHGILYILGKIGNSSVGWI